MISIENFFSEDKSEETIVTNEKIGETVLVMVVRGHVIDDVGFWFKRIFYQKNEKEVNLVKKSKSEREGIKSITKHRE